MTFLKIGKISGPLIVHFDVFSGVDFLGRRAEIFGILTSAFAIVFLNAFLADFFYNRERFLSYVFSFGSAGLCLLILIAMGVIISVN
ncbi:MAG: hypothetical protein UU85_C0002G0007 [Candidatus Wolfebacteria bacterium GW2011_GWA2_42_10]|uniref:Uncharacterized protein n=1 Tax=Candidatus Wolfebacteria bacterium GW2011_GWA2_42_10 TaxID=1619004 RepID=A0A0G1AJP9_9BACT|nr:MAG: hypothetical protein UU85_C0002G0007 [Candidatus Wolfebacteria bacterium GW2011_GWA2_42_10]